MCVHFPPDCNPVGSRQIYNQYGIEMCEFFFAGEPSGAHSLGHVRKGLSPDLQIESVVTVITGLPPEVFIG